MAFETDFGFYQLFENSANPDQAARDYLGDFVNYISGIYVNDLNTELEISSISLWDSEQAQPWQNLGPRRVNCLFYGMGLYWKDPANDVDATRTVAHFVTGPSTTGGGVAWLSILCAAGNFAQVDTSQDECVGFTGMQDVIGDFGASADLTGTFDAQTQPNVWDYAVVAHELGHNFGSDHTHCYNTVTVPGFQNNGVIDECFAGETNANGTCWAGDQSLPGPVGEGSGTIMSYCHLLEGRESKIAPSFGLDHPFGREPERVPTVMRSHVPQAADPNNPRCPQLVTAGASFLVSTQVQGDGSISPTSANVQEGQTTSFTLTPAAGATVQSATGCNGALQGNIYTTGAINAACTVSVVFSQAQAPNPLCVEVNQAIPDDDPQGITSTLTVNDGGTIDKLEVLLDIEHTYVGDLIIDLRHGPSDTTVRLVNRPGGGNCSGEDIKVTLDDQAGPSIQDNCQDTAAAYPEERYRPANPLSAFNGSTITGDWVLTVSDNAGADTGQLSRWCLVPTTSGIQIEIFSDRFQQQQ